MISASELREILHYDEKTGVFTWKHRTDSRPQWNGKFSGKTAGNINSCGYIQIMINRKNYTAHRLAWLYMTGDWPVAEIDHIDLCRSNNSWSNLRNATRSENAHNTPGHKDSMSGIKGVHYMKTGKRLKRWTSDINVSGKKIHLGYFLTKDEAADAYAKASNEYHGSYGRTSHG